MERVLDTETRTAEYTDSTEPEDDRPEGRVLWGRFVFWGVMLLLLFLLGRWSAPNGVPESQLAELDQQVTELSQRNQELQSLLEAQQAAVPDGAADPDADAGAEPGVDTADASPTEAEGAAEGEAANDADAQADAPADAQADAPADPPPGSRTYTVQDGDTLNGIAERMYGDGTQSSLIVQANGVDRDTPLHIGQELVIPPAD